ncbi:helix-turn-helix transcriptional regulator [Mucilaginibacter sp. SMC90]|uniref:helix-turn-helix domain-containing protein n=1 Tax=Mucilaginibacter sp. SMC90 TaxID=2929803 RepID=UPI001FB36C81|nr:helix-turn-helix domain-containing protein [Mucilaginibacter sp. SMC90]UOE50874.1 helix-turn-helix transcriptional regulator [Mucilaginibacter sp. SMC90]
MAKRSGTIPVNTFGNESDEGITIDRVSFDTLPPLGDWQQPERHDRHSFFLLESGSVTMEIDFHQYDIESPSFIYLHPDQVHRIIGFDHVTVYAWALDNAHLNTDFVKLLEEISPASPLKLNIEQFNILSETADLLMKFWQRKNVPLFYSLLKEQGNALVGLSISLYQENIGEPDALTRQEQITRSFRQQLGINYTTKKRPSDYAELLNISVPYLNECVKHATGQPVSWHIQQRLILEAKRQLYHSDLSLKEIAAMLGYDEYPYFSRLFTKIVGTSPASFRPKNLG